MTSPLKVSVRLSDDQRQTLRRLVRTGTHPSTTLRRAQVLPKADVDGPDAWGDPQVSKAPGCPFMTVRRVRQQFGAEGLDATPHRKRPTGRLYRKLDGGQDAQPVAVACSPAPAGRARRTMTRRADRSVETKVIDAIDPATVWRTPKKTTSSPGSSGSGSSRPRRARRS